MKKLEHWSTPDKKHQIIIYDEMIVVIADKIIYKDGNTYTLCPALREYHIKDCCIMSDGTIGVIPERHLAPYKLITDISERLANANETHIDSRQHIVSSTLFTNENGNYKHLKDIIRNIYDMVFNKVLNRAVENKWTKVE